MYSFFWYLQIFKQKKLLREIVVAKDMVVYVFIYKYIYHHIFTTETYLSPKREHNIKKKNIIGR